MANLITKENQLLQTKGTWEARGKLFNVKSENAFKINDKENWRTMNLGLRISDSEVMYFTIKAGNSGDVTLSKRGPNKGDKNETKKVPFKDRLKESKNGWSTFGVSLGITKNDEGKNEVVNMHPWDAWEYCQENLVDDMSLFVAGEIEFSTFKSTDDKGNETVKKYQNFVAKKIYLATAEIDFQSEKFEKHAGFSQTFLMVAPHKEDGYFLELAHVGYGSFENVIVECTETMYNLLKEKGLKRNNALTFTGVLKTSVTVDEAKVEDTWGEKSVVGSNRTPAKTVLLITGADGSTLDKTTYTQKAIDEYLELLKQVEEEKEKKKNGFDKQEDGGAAWGEKSKVVAEEDTPW